MEELPNEMLDHIFGFLPCAMLWGAPLLVCWRWHDALLDRVISGTRTCVGHPIALLKHRIERTALDAARISRALDARQLPTLTNKDRWCEMAARASHLSCLQWARSRGCPWNSLTCVAAATNGDMRTLCWAHTAGCNIEHSDVTEAAARRGHVDCFEYALANGAPCTRTCVNVAVADGRLCIVERIARMGVHFWDENTVKEAALGGHLECVDFLIKHGCVWSPHACEAAARNGHLRVLEYAHENGHPWGQWVTYSAALYGQVECLEYALRHGCKADGAITKVAAEKDHLDVLVCAHRLGIEWSGGSCEMALRQRHVECLRFLLLHDCPWYGETDPAHIERAYVLAGLPYGV